MIETIQGLGRRLLIYGGREPEDAEKANVSAALFEVRSSLST